MILSFPTNAKHIELGKFFLTGAIIALLSLVALRAAANEVAYTEHCFGVAFRETPYADIKCAGRVRPEGVGEAKHFELDYDNDGRLTEVRYVQNGELRPYSGRFVRAAKTKISYSDGIELRTYFDKNGHRTVVSGDVYETRIKLALNGDRALLAFHDVDGRPTENDFHIAVYEWAPQSDGSIIETRRRLDGTVQRNRPGFGYFVTRFSYDSRGLLRLMTNLGLTGQSVTPDEAGIVSTQIRYDQRNRFTQWTNLSATGLPQRGMSGIAEIRYIPSRFGGEQVASFFDADGSPQMTRWGAHKVEYEFDEYGNETLRIFHGNDGATINASNGVGRIITRWNENGAYRKSRTYYDKLGARIGITTAAIHEYRTDFDSAGRPSRTGSYSLTGELVDDPGTGFAIDETKFDDHGRAIERRFLDQDGALADHAEWGVARFVYSFSDSDELTSVKAFTKSGAVAKPSWNPSH